IVGSPAYRQMNSDDSIAQFFLIPCIFNDELNFRELVLAVNEVVRNTFNNRELLLKTNTATDCIGVTVELAGIHENENVRSIDSDITFAFRIVGNRMILRVVYDEILYERSNVSSIAQHVVHLFNQALFQPDRPLVEVDIVSE